MINNSHFIVEFPEKTHSTQYIRGEIIDKEVVRWGLGELAPHQVAHC